MPDPTLTLIAILLLALFLSLLRIVQLHQRARRGSQELEQSRRDGQKAREAVRILARTGTILSSSFDRETLLSQILLVMADALPGVRILILLYDPEGLEWAGKDAPRGKVPTEEEVERITRAGEAETGSWASLGLPGLRRLFNFPLINNETYAGSFVLLSEQGLDSSSRLLLADIAGQVGAAVHNLRTSRERNRIHERFGRVVDPRVRDHLLAGRSPLGGELRDATILFVDLRNFTTYAEAHSPQEVVAFLNGFLADMADCVESRGGLVNKFTGDGFLALFGAPTDLPDHPALAVEAAIAMVEKAQNFPLGLGIGIETGRVLAGTIGSPTRMEYTVIGDAVNTASRLEGLGKFYGASILVSEEVFRRCAPGRFCGRSLGPVRVKGRTSTLEMVEVLGRTEAPFANEKARNTQLFGQAFQAYRGRDFVLAACLFDSVLERSPGDRAAERYRDNARRFLAEGSSLRWDGVEVFQEK